MVVLLAREVLLKAIEGELLEAESAIGLVLELNGEGRRAHLFGVERIHGESHGVGVVLVELVEFPREETTTIG